MIQQNDQHQNDNLIDGDDFVPNIAHQDATSKLYNKSATHFTITNLILLFHAILKFIGSIGLLIVFHIYCQEFEQTQLWQWSAVLAIHSFMAMIYYIFLLNWMFNQSNRIQIARELAQTRANQINEQQFSVAEETRNVSLMAVQIKQEVQKKTWCGKYLARFCFLSYQICFFWGMSLFFVYYNKESFCEKVAFNFLIIILFLGIYQYIDFYILALFAIICLPILIVAGIYFCINMYVIILNLNEIIRCQEKRQQQIISQALQSKKYKPNQFAGDPQCSICYCPYEIDEDIVQLACSTLHHFHESCIKSWILVSNTCPLCRSPVHP